MEHSSKFVTDTLMIDAGLNLSFTENDVKCEQLKAVFLPYYTEQESLDMMIVLKRTIMPAQSIRAGKKMGLEALTVELPMDNPLSIEQAFSTLNIETKIINAIPFGCVMPDPVNSTLAYELVLLHIEPLNLLFKENGIYSQKPNEYEIGVVAFKDLLHGIQNNVITDLKTRMILDEFYILASEEAKAQNNGNHDNSGKKDLLNGGANLPAGYGSQNGTVKTRDIPEEVLQANSKKDHGALYTAPVKGFQTITR